jgi:Membrane bound beta barrel domain (DUF5777)
MMIHRRVVLFLLILAMVAYWPGQAAAQNASATQAAQAPPDDPDLDLVPLQPDFTIVAMPTALRLPRFKSSFRITHRFGRPLGQGDFGDLLEDFLGIDSGAQIGLEYRFGLMRGTQVGIHRTNDRTIEFFAQYDLMQERDGRPLNLAVLASIDGTNNFRDSYSPALGVVVSRSFAPVGTIFVHPIWVNNSNPLPSELADDNDSVLIGVGTRLRIRPTVYLVGEIIPRVTGFDPGVNQAAFGIEKRAGGHVFQLNFSNSLGTTMGQIARGGTSNDDWFLGFNISRKFF